MSFAKVPLRLSLNLSHRLPLDILLQGMSSKMCYLRLSLNLSYCLPQGYSVLGNELEKVPFKAISEPLPSSPRKGESAAGHELRKSAIETVPEPLPSSPTKGESACANT